MHIWRDYKTLAYAALFTIPTAKSFYNFGSEIKKALDRETMGMTENNPIGLIFAGFTAVASSYIGLPFSLMYCSKLFGKVRAKARLTDAKFIKKTIERLPVV